MTLREKVHNIVDIISEKKLTEVIDFLEYVKIREEIEATNEILDDKKLVEKIRTGLKQMEKGELVDFEDIKVNV